MHNNLFTTMRSLKLIEGCKGVAQVYALNPSSSSSSSSSSDSGAGDQQQLLRPSFSILRSKSIQHHQHHHAQSHSVLFDSLLHFGLPSPDHIDPLIDPFLRPVDPIAALASCYRRLSDHLSGDCSPSSPSSSSICDLYLEQHALLRSLADPKLLRRSLRQARLHAGDPHHRLVLSAWLRIERREDELPPHSLILVPCPATSPSLECPTAALSFDPPSGDLCHCRRRQTPATHSEDEDDEEDEDVWFCIGDDEVGCVRRRIAALSMPLHTLLYGGFAESRRERINFTHNKVSVDAMKAVDAFSRSSAGTLDADIAVETLLEVLSFSNKFCCEGLKSAVDARLSSSVLTANDAMELVEFGLDEAAYLLVASCLQVFLRALPRSLHDPDVAHLLCSPEGFRRLSESGNASFLLYHFLSHVAMDEDIQSNTTVMLLERLVECSSPGWQKQLALHQLGCAMLDRGEFKDAQKLFEEAAGEGHLYSLAGAARAKFKRGHKFAAYKQMSSLITENADPVGWMYQERSLYCIGKEKMADLGVATELDPTLSYPYKYRAVSLMEDNKISAAIAEINKIIRFRVSTDCLELRAWFFIAIEDYEGAIRDMRALVMLDPGYLVFHGRARGDQVIDVLKRHVQQLDMADCWMQLYDRWSAVDDIGSLAVVHHMLAKDPRNSSLWFRQSLLLLRLNCQKAAMQSLRLARNHSSHEHDRLVYEGWILYDTGHREEALAKAEESISIQRSFEAFFLKAYALADTSLDHSSSEYVIRLLEQAISCASDNLRKGQAHNNMGSVYVDCEMLDEAAECYRKALGIKHTRAHQGLARVHYLKGQKKAAYDEMTKLIEKAKNNASAYEKRSEYCDRDMARSDLNTATMLDPLRTYPYRYRAAVLMDDHKEEEAIAELSKAIAFKPDIQLLHLRAAFFDSMGDRDTTLRDCEAALCLDPGQADTLDLYNKALDKGDADQEKPPL